MEEGKLTVMNSKNLGDILLLYISLKLHIKHMHLVMPHTYIIYSIKEHYFWANISPSKKNKYLTKPQH